jgi:uncharacterized membrane protein YcgQ (UPF0703/DUF1980 family)
MVQKNKYIDTIVKSGLMNYDLPMKNTWSDLISDKNKFANEKSLPSIKTTRLSFLTKIFMTALIVSAVIFGILKYNKNNNSPENIIKAQNYSFVVKTIRKVIPQKSTTEKINTQKKNKKKKNLQNKKTEQNQKNKPKKITIIEIKKTEVDTIRQK